LERQPETTADRGGRWVAAQFTLLPLVFLAVLVPPRWPDAVRVPLAVAAALLATAGVAAVWGAARALGRGLTPFPEPPSGAELVEHGPFRIVRHPTYAGMLAFLVGWSLVAGVVALLVTCVLAALWVGKLRVEERRLHARFPAYADYTTRIRWRLVPGVY
jgi:protein-S-isoprenylcysteine O-methyltransferase